MKLNRKGYLTVEVILASVVAATIAIFLMEITIKLVNITDDEYVSTDLMTEKALIIKNIKNFIEEDIKENGTISNINVGTNMYYIDYENDSNYFFIKIENKNNKNYLIYSRKGNEIYRKELDNSLYNIHLYEHDNGDYYDFYITADNKFSKESYRIDIIVKNS